MNKALYFLRRFRPGGIYHWGKHYVRRLRRRIAQANSRCVVLEPGKPNSDAVLFSYIIDPFLLKSGQPMPYGHTNFWESWQMADTFRRHGYRVEVIHWTNNDFAPKRDYAYYIDVRRNFARIAPRLNHDCTKILHIDTAHHKFHNSAQRQRLAELFQRRGIDLPPVKLLEETPAIELSDMATVLGNEFTMDTYRFAQKPLHRIPISCPFTYPFPEQKDFSACRRNFLWFGSEGFVHKGLDLVLDAFAAMPEFQLTVCGPLSREPRFEYAYYRELYQLPNIKTIGWVDIASRQFREIMNHTAALIYPSCSEGGGGGVINCMHAGVMPVVSRESSVDVLPENGFVLPNCSVEQIQNTVRQVAALSSANLRQMSLAAWEFVRNHHTREHFAVAYENFVKDIPW